MSPNRTKDYQIDSKTFVLESRNNIGINKPQSHL